MRTAQPLFVPQRLSLQVDPPKDPLPTKSRTGYNPCVLANSPSERPGSNSGLGYRGLRVCSAVLEPHHCSRVEDSAIEASCFSESLSVVPLSLSRLRGLRVHLGSKSQTGIASGFTNPNTRAEAMKALKKICLARVVGPYSSSLYVLYYSSAEVYSYNSIGLDRPLACDLQTTSNGFVKHWRCARRY